MSGGKSVRPGERVKGINVYVVELDYDGKPPVGHGELLEIISSTLSDCEYGAEQIRVRWEDKRQIMALKNGVPEAQTLSEVEAQGFAHNYPGMHLFFADEV